MRLTTRKSKIINFQKKKKRARNLCCFCVVWWSTNKLLCYFWKDLFREEPAQKPLIGWACFCFSFLFWSSFSLFETTPHRADTRSPFKCSNSCEATASLSFNFLWLTAWIWILGFLKKIIKKKDFICDLPRKKAGRIDKDFTVNSHLHRNGENSSLSSCLFDPAAATWMNWKGKRILFFLNYLFIFNYYFFHFDLGHFIPVHLSVFFSSPCRWLLANRLISIVNNERKDF